VSSDETPLRLSGVGSCPSRRSSRTQPICPRRKLRSRRNSFGA